MKINSKLTWRVGTTTFNRSDLMSEIIDLASITNDFVSMNNGKKWRESQKNFYYFATSKNPSLFFSNKKDKAEISRQITSALVNFNLADQERKLNIFGQLLIEKNKANKNIIKISNHFSISYNNTIFLLSLVHHKSETQPKFNPFVLIINYLFENQKVSIENILRTHKAKNIREFNDFLSGKAYEEILSDSQIPNEDLTQKITSEDFFSNNNGKDKNKYLNDLYSLFLNRYINHENEEIFKRNLNQFQLKMKKDQKAKKIINNIKNKFNTNEVKNLFEFNKKMILGIGEIYWDAGVKGQKSQLKNALVMMGIFNLRYENQNIFVYLNKNKVISMKDIFVLTEEISTIEKYFLKIKFNSKSFDKNIDYLEIMQKVMQNYKVFSSFDKNELYLINEFPTNLLIDMKSYVLLEYLTAIKIAEIFSINPKDIINPHLLDEHNLLISHAPGGSSDLEIENYLIEVTNSLGNNTMKLELEPVTRHLATKKYESQKEYLTLFFSKDPVPLQFIYDSLMKRNYKYFFEKSYDNKENINGLQIIPMPYKYLDHLTIDKIKKIIKFHKEYKINGNLTRKDLEEYRKTINEISNK